MPAVKPMLAKDAVPAKLRFPLYVQPKLDGIRALVVNGRVQSRSGKPIANAEIQAALGRPEFEGLDGELIVGSPTAERCFQETTSYVRGEKKTGGDWAFYVFDLWNHPGTYKERLSALCKQSWTMPGATYARIQFVANVTADSAEDLEAIEGELLAQGYEGAILRGPETRYKHGRSSPTGGELLKLKRFTDFEAEVIGVFEERHNTNVAITNALGRTERSSAQDGKVGKGTLGGLELRALNGPWEGVEFRCGTGFTAEQRADLWAEYQRDQILRDHGPEHCEILGRVAKVKAFEVGAKDKPRFPVWLGWRAPEDRS